MREVGLDLQKCDFYTAYQRLYCDKAHLEGVKTLLTWCQISTFERHLLPLLGLLCPTFESVVQLDWSEVLPLPLQLSCYPIKLSGPFRAADVLP